VLRETTSRGLCGLVCPSRTSAVCLLGSQCVFITAVPITKLFALGEGGTMGDMCYERLRAEAFVD
jgi:hypothetical protein